ncbi:hypothetical protein [Rhodococcus sp. ARC_M6]|nr:hypothetical protein [Rhodococcus sp. ARC_M6]
MPSSPIRHGSLRRRPDMGGHSVPSASEHVEHFDDIDDIDAV